MQKSNNIKVKVNSQWNHSIFIHTIFHTLNIKFPIGIKHKRSFNGKQKSCEIAKEKILEKYTLVISLQKSPDQKTCTQINVMCHKNEATQQYITAFFIKIKEFFCLFVA